ncbi:MAG: 4'-phosphopantetheinyl transferase superfamily protein [Gemmatimonadales bacterium]|nr:4'-phosphopantetheinyl transferase superfamily protein [Gemmatimonadales bacterium]
MAALSAVAEVWAVHLDVGDGVVSALRRCLSGSESLRADRFLHPRDRRRHVVSHGALRAILAKRLGIEPQGVRFAAGDHGKPALADDRGTRLEFNLAHSGELALCVLAVGVRVGVDLEALREVPDAEAILRGSFAPLEVDDWLQVPAERRQEAFLRLWTCKEAWLKACGRGLSLPIDRSDIRVSGDAAWFRSLDGSTAEAGRWCLQLLRPAEGYVGAVCAEATALDLRVREWVGASQAHAWPDVTG